MFYIYILKDDNGRVYIGVTQNLRKREVTHNTKRGALFTKSGNFQIVFHELYDTLAEARSREIQIKKWRREKKERVIERFKQGLPTKMRV